MQQDRRRSHRTKMSKEARIVLGEPDYLSINCTVLNLSSGGACIDVDVGLTLPGAVELTFDAARTLRPCRVAWGENGRFGVAFRKAFAK